MRFDHWLVKGVLLGASLVVIGGLILPRFRLIEREHRLGQTRKDFKELFINTASYGIDRCGVHYPPDTGVRRRETPEWPLTFETDFKYYQGRAYTGTGFKVSDPFTISCSLTTPIAYMKALPCDPFRRDGGFYGYFTCSANPGRMRELALLRSVGPDGREDLPMADLKEAIEECMRAQPPQSRLITFNPEFCSWVRAWVDPHMYDPTNGAASRGDLIMVMDHCSLRYGWGGSDPTWTNLKQVGFRRDFMSKQPLPDWDFEQPLPQPRDYDQNLWANARFRISASLCDAFARAGIMVEQGEFYALEGTKRKPFEERLNRLRNHFGPFREFFQKPAPLTAEQVKALKAWRDEDPAWWKAVEDSPGFSISDKTVPARLSDFLNLMVIYGKCKTLLAAELTSGGDPRRASQHLTQLDTLLLSFYRSVEPVGGNPASTNPAYGFPFFSRVHEELGRLVREERIIVQGP